MVSLYVDYSVNRINYSVGVDGYRDGYMCTSGGYIADLDDTFPGDGWS